VNLTCVLFLLPAPFFYVQEKTDIEGTLFLYARSGDPKHGFVVMNRLSTENLIEPITKDLEIQEQAPFLLYKNAKYAITGVWFYEESECRRIAEKLVSLVKEESTRRRPQVPAVVPSSTPGASSKSGVDILSLLTKAQGEYEQKGKVGEVATQSVFSSSSVEVVRPTALRPTSNGAQHSASLSVADLFSSESAGPVPTMPLHHGGGMFERLLSGTAASIPPPALPNTELHTAQNLERELRAKLKVSQVVDKGISLPHTSPHSAKPGGLATAIAHPQVVEILQNPSGTPPRNVGAQVLQSVPLMSPMMFASTPTVGGPAAASTGAMESHPTVYQEANRPQSPVHRSTYGVAPLPEPVQPQSEPENQVSPLTKAQLLQSINYLLKNDPNFITQLHDAYVQSLKQSLKASQ